MKHVLTIFVLSLCMATAHAEKYSKLIDTDIAGKISLTCEQTDSWQFSTSVEKSNGKEFITIKLRCTTPQVPPKFSISFTLPQKDIYHLWHPCATTRYRFYPDWNGKSWQKSQLAVSIPLLSFFNEHNQNAFLLACDEVFHTVKTQMAIREEGCIMCCEMKYFDEPAAPMTDYTTTILLDNRNIFWSDAIQEATKWIDTTIRLTPCNIPESAFAPLYSTWYQFHQDVHAKDIEEECAIASKLGMKTIIIDDGWQTDDTNRGYGFCGDWEISTKRFPDMVAHVKKVQSMGMKYMLWYSVPFMGYYSKNFKRFKGKFLRLSDHSKAGVLDPRFPEVREFLAETYEKALKNWGIDGFKLDFIDQFTITGTDPAIAENYAGRDYKSVPEATDALMKEITARLQRIKPDILIEFRQAYMGPAIRQYGNMIRVGDCPGDLQANRIGIANLRLTSGTTAVHADMLEWNKEEYPLNVARTIISCIFGVIQYSAMLRDIPQDNQNVIRHWLTFSQEHQDALLKGQFKPYSPEASFPVIKAENNQERIIAVYQDNMAVNVGKKDKNIYILNGTYNYYIIAEVPANLKLKTFDMYGKETSNTKLKPGIQYLPIPAGGYGLLY